MRRVVLALLLGLGAMRSADAQEAKAETDGLLRPGDAIRITVWRKPEMSGDFNIAADGTVKHPLYHELRVSGISGDSLRGHIAEFLKRYEADPQFTAEPLFRIAVAGEVRRPDLYTFPAETTMGQALILAGGVTENGRLDRVRLIRDGREQILDLSRPEAGAAARTIQSGDQILVGRSRAILRELVGPIASVVSASGVILTIMLRR